MVELFITITAALIASKWYGNALGRADATSESLLKAKEAYDKQKTAKKDI